MTQLVLVQEGAGMCPISGTYTVTDSGTVTSGVTTSGVAGGVGIPLPLMAVAGVVMVVGLVATTGSKKEGGA
jgi:hypothetical protein